MHVKRKEAFSLGMYRIQLREVVESAKFGCGVLLREHLVVFGLDSTTIVRNFKDCAQCKRRKDE
jgi:hypothetical protein